MPSESFDLDEASVSGETVDVATVPEVNAEVGDPAVTEPVAGDVADATPPVPDEPYVPTWVDEMSGLMDNPNQGVIPQGPPGYPPTVPSAPYPQQYQQPPPQQYYPPQPPQPDPAQKQRDLDAMLENPNQYIAQIASQAAAPSQQYIAAMEHDVRRLTANSQNQAFNAARQSLDHGYREVLNKDNTFRGNEDVRKVVDGFLQRAMWNLKNSIAQGDYNAGSALQDPTFFPTLLHSAKLKCGVAFTGNDAMPPAGANMETVSPPTDRDSGVQLDPDLQGVAEALGPAYAKQLKAAVAEAEKRGDMEF